MLIIGLTGGIGSGKSTVANFFATHGVPIIDTDVIAREITLPHQPAFKKIIAHFSKSILQKDGTLDRTALRNIIFKYPNERNWLEYLLHPLIKKEVEQQTTLLSAPYCIIVIPLLFESKPYPFINRILVVDATEQTQIERVTARDHSDKSQVMAILKAQATREQRLKGADDVILNDGTLTKLSHQVNELHRFYCQLSTQ